MSTAVFGATSAVLSAIAVRCWYRRWRFAHRPGAFRCIVRVRVGAVAGVPVDWPHGRQFAVWTHEVLSVASGAVPWRVVPLTVRTVLSSVTPAVDAVSGLGRGPVALLLEVADAVVELVSAEHDRTLLTGPYRVGYLLPVPAN